LGNKIISNGCSIRNPFPNISLKKIGGIGSPSNDSGGVKELCVKVSAGEPGFSRFGSPKDLLFKRKIIKGNLKV
jgi:hypothetical protein